MTTSRNNTIMSWMAYTDFLSRLRIAAGILLPLNTRTLLLYPGGRDCIGTAGVDAYEASTVSGFFRAFFRLHKKKIIFQQPLLW